jgi:hypothetical protein
MMLNSIFSKRTAGSEKLDVIISQCIKNIISVWFNKAVIINYLNALETFKIMNIELDHISKVAIP